LRRYSSTVQASQDEHNELIGLGRKTPFDDSPNPEAGIDDISPLLVREFLNNVHSALIEQIETQTAHGTSESLL
jgi:ATP-dependent DNA helicase RecG